MNEIDALRADVDRLHKDAFERIGEKAAMLKRIKDLEGQVRELKKNITELVKMLDQANAEIMASKEKR